ncbi:hypothetical protein [Burkholderia ubonensis]|uniref:hypothetical protein n=1 Tax=Burkholderia ubonensis TaxID=101571 RepID=UPI0011605AB5|nr:hypothetical protein [Burkholderia ubonensis]
MGNVANGGTGNQQSANFTVSAGDWQALHQYLKSVGVPDDEANSMKVELDEIRGRDRETAQAKEREWIGRVVGRVATTAGGVAVDAGATGVAKAIAGYLGFPVS